jgi:hypothetical protein
MACRLHLAKLLMGNCVRNRGSENVSPTLHFVKLLKDMASITSISSTATGIPEQLKQDIVKDVLSLYQLKITPDSFKHYAPNAVFLDPLSEAKGYLKIFWFLTKLGKKSVAAAFYSLPFFFSKTEILRATPNVPNDALITIDMQTKYFYKVFSSKSITIDSIVYLTIQNGQIVKHEERWDNKMNPNSEDGIGGVIKEHWRIANAKMLNVFFAPKELPTA